MDLINILLEKGGYVSGVCRFDFSVLSLKESEQLATPVKESLQKAILPFLKEYDNIWKTDRNTHDRIKKICFYSEGKNCSCYLLSYLITNIDMITQDITHTTEDSGIQVYNPQLIHNLKDGPDRKKVIIILEVLQNSYQIEELMSRSNEGDELIAVVCWVNLCPTNIANGVPILSVQNYSVL